MAESEDRVFTTELIWDTGTDGTAIPRELPLRATPLQVGPEGGWLPVHLMAAAAAGSFMSSLLRLAAEAGLCVLGFVSNSRLRIPGDPSERPTLALEPCIVIASEQEVERMRELCEQAVQDSDMCRMLEDRVDLEPDIQVLAGRRGRQTVTIALPAASSQTGSAPEISLRDYYRRPAVRDRIVEYCGGHGGRDVTCVFLGGIIPDDPSATA